MHTLRALLVLVCASFLTSSATALAHETSSSGSVPFAPAATIDFTQPATPAYAGTSVVLNSVAANGMPVAYTVISGPASVSGSTLTYTGVGQVIVEANENDGSDPPPPVRRTVDSILLTQPLGEPSAAVNTIIKFIQAGTIATIDLETQGAIALDFTPASGSTCLVGSAYAAGDTCTVSFVFTPRRPGLRFGGIALTAANGNLLANSYIVGVGTGPQILYNPPDQISVGSGFGGLSGVAVDGSGNVYGSDIVGGGVYQVSAATGAVRQIASTAGTTDVSVDGSGNVFYADRQKVYEILAVNGAIPPNPEIRTLVDGFISIDGLKVDAFGNVYIAEGGSRNTDSSIAVLQAVNGTIPSPATPKVIASSVGTPTGVAVDIMGNVFFSDQDAHNVQEIHATNGVITTPTITVVSNAFGVPTNVTTDVSGNVYVPDEGTHNVQELLAVNGTLPANPTIIQLGQNLMFPEGATVDASGNLYVADRGQSSVIELAYGAPPTLTFAPTQVGQTSSDSPKSVSITNGGNADLLLTAPATGTNPSIAPQSFIIDAGSTCPVLTPGSGSGSLAQGTSCSYAIDFMPLVQGTVQGQLVSTDNNQGVMNATQTIQLNATGLGIPPAISFLVADHTYGDLPFTVAATSNSQGAFSYSVLSGPASVVGSTVTLTGAGTVVLRAEEAASGNYSTGQQDAAFLVTREAQAITFVPPPSPIPYTSAPLTLQATASSGLPITFSVLSGPAQVGGSILTVLGGGTVIVAADQPGDANFLPALQVRKTIIVTFGAAAAILTATPTPVFVTNPVQLNAVVTGGGGFPSGTVQFLDGATIIGAAPIVNGNAALITTTLGVGTHSISAAYRGDSNFRPVQSASAQVVVEDFSITISKPDAVIEHGGTATYSISMNPIGGSTVPSDLQFTMRGGPQYGAGSFSPQVLRAGSGPGLVTLLVHTPNFPSPQAWSNAPSSRGLSLAALSLGLVTLSLQRKRRQLRGMASRALILVLLLGAMACATVTGCGSGWRTQYWTLSVTATSGNLSHSANATLTSRCEGGSDACPVH